jgi:hypothetical protein
MSGSGEVEKGENFMNGKLTEMKVVVKLNQEGGVKIIELNEAYCFANWSRGVRITLKIIVDITSQK